MTPLGTGYQPTPSDVICQKGKEAKEHPGNKLLQSLVCENLQKYSECTSKLDRSFIVSIIIKTMQQDHGSRFIRKKDNNGCWYDIGPKNVREKIGQNFRDSLHTQFKSSAKAKARRKSLHTSSSTTQQSLAFTSTTTTSASSRCFFHSMVSVSEVSIATGDNSISAQYDGYGSIGKADCCEDLEPIPLHEAYESDVPNLPADCFGWCGGQVGGCIVPTSAELTDLEPLPLTQAFEVNYDLSRSSLISELSTFEEAVDELLRY
jgi:hypothetical protein